MSARAVDQSGFTMVELIFVMLVLTLVMAGLSNAFISGLRASSDGNARLAAQATIRSSVDRLEYEVRCSDGAVVSGGGSTVVLSLPSQCVHATGSYTWCVTSASLYRYSGGTCSGSGQIFAKNVTTPTPFTLLTATGYLPRLQIALSVNALGSSDGVSINDQIALRNAARS